MKKITVLVFAIVCLMAGRQSHAQENVVKFNIFSPIVKTFNVAYERVLNENSTAQLGLAITGIKIGDTKFSGLQVTPEYRYYLTGDSAPDGTYIAPFVRYSNFTLKVEGGGITTDEADFTSFGGGAVIGRQWLLGDSDLISFDIFLGPTFSSGNIKVKSGNSASFETGGFEGFGLRFGVTLGLAF